MKRMSNVLVAAAMMLGTFGAVGCNRPSEMTDLPEAQPVTAPAPQSDAPAAQPEAVKVVATTTTTTRLPAPPVLRVENPGRAPSTHHRWMRGFWRWDAPRTVYVWSPGFWQDEIVVAPYAPPALRYEDPGCAPGADYTFAPGFWRWSGREYVWVSGHWTARRDAGFYQQPRWSNVNGRWQPRFDGDGRRDFGDHRGDHDGFDRRDGDRQHGQAVPQPAARPAARATITVKRPLALGVTVKHG